VAVDLKIALCELLGSVIASMIDKEESTADLTPAWYKAIEDLYSTALYFTKKSKAFHVGETMKNIVFCICSALFSWVILRRL
jgi:hypothetical protein